MRRDGGTDRDRDGRADRPEGVLLPFDDGFRTSHRSEPVQRAPDGPARSNGVSGPDGMPVADGPRGRARRAGPSRHWPIACAWPVSRKAAHSSTGGRGGGVGDGDDLDLALAVDGEVDGGADDVARQCASESTIIPGRGRLRAPPAQALGRGPEEEDAVLPAQIALVGQGAQQVVGGGEGKTGLPGELLGRRPSRWAPTASKVATPAEPNRSASGQRYSVPWPKVTPRHGDGLVSPLAGAAPTGPPRAWGPETGRLAQTTGQDGDGPSFPSWRQRYATVSARSATREVSTST